MNPANYHNKFIWWPTKILFVDNTQEWVWLRIVQRRSWGTNKFGHKVWLWRK